MQGWAFATPSMKRSRYLVSLMAPCAQTCANIFLLCGGGGGHFPVPNPCMFSPLLLSVCPGAFNARVVYAKGLTTRAVTPQLQPVQGFLIMAIHA